MVENITESSKGQDSNTHKKLLRIASIANIFVWIVLAMNTLFAFSSLVRDYNTYNYTNLTSINADNFPPYWEMLSKNPLYLSSVIVDMLNIFLRGVVFAIVLKGVSLGLNMIVEINFNQQEPIEEESNG